MLHGGTALAHVRGQAVAAQAALFCLAEGVVLMPVWRSILSISFGHYLKGKVMENSINNLFMAYCGLFRAIKKPNNVP
jgi:hypothetical protein